MNLHSYQQDDDAIPPQEEDKINSERRVLYLPDNTSGSSAKLYTIIGAAFVFFSCVVYGVTSSSTIDIDIEYEGGEASAQPRGGNTSRQLDYGTCVRASECRTYTAKLIECESTPYASCATSKHSKHLHYGPNPYDPKAHEVGKMFWYATPSCMTKDLYQVDKAWGGAHVTLGEASSYAGKYFDDIKDLLSPGGTGFKTSHWSPASSSTMNYKGKCDKYNGYHMSLSSDTLTKVLSVLTDYNDINPGRIKKQGAAWADSTKLHISTVTSGHIKSSKKIKNILTQDVFWDLALVKVEMDTTTNKVSIKRLKTTYIYNSKKS